jgi:hypothetical protein
MRSTAFDITIIHDPAKYKGLIYFGACFDEGLT